MKSVRHESFLRVESQTRPGVSFDVIRMSFGRRMELSRRIRSISQRVQFLDAGDTVQDKIEAGILGQEIDAMYLDWGLVKITGLLIDGEPATGKLLLERGPDELTHEIVSAIKHQCGLTDSERKN